MSFLIRNRIEFVPALDICGEEGPEVIVVGFLCEDCCSAPAKSYCILAKNHRGDHSFATGLDKRLTPQRAF